MENQTQQLFSGRLRERAQHPRHQGPLTAPALGSFQLQRPAFKQDQLSFPGMILQGYYGPQGALKQLSYQLAQPLPTFEQGLLEGLCELALGRNLAQLQALQVRELESFLRDVNHVPAFVLGPEHSQLHQRAGWVLATLDYLMEGALWAGLGYYQDRHEAPETPAKAPVNSFKDLDLAGQVGAIEAVFSQGARQVLANYGLQLSFVHWDRTGKNVVVSLTAEELEERMRLAGMSFLARQLEFSLGTRVNLVAE